MTLTFRKYDMGGFKGTFTLSAKPADAFTVTVAEHVPAGDDLKMLSVRNQHSDLPGAAVAATRSGSLTLTAPAADTVYDAFFFPQIDTSIQRRGSPKFDGSRLPVNYGCLDRFDSRLGARPTVAGIYTAAMTPPEYSELRGGAEPIVSEAVRRLNEAWKPFPDFAVHRIDLDRGGRVAPFMMGLGMMDFSPGHDFSSATLALVDPDVQGHPYDLVERMVGVTFAGLFQGWADVACDSSVVLLNPEERATAGISDTGKMVLYYFAVR